MKIRIVVDSSVNLFEMEGLDIVSVPLKIRTTEKEYVDDVHLDVHQMNVDLSTYKGKSTSSCPNSAEWLDAFEPADEIYALTISKALSGSYNAAVVAKDMLLEEHPEKKVYIVDSRSIGGECRLIIEKIKEWIEAGKSFDEIVPLIEAYQKTTELQFDLQSLNNLANNGRVNKMLADLIGVFGIVMVGKPTAEGKIEMISKKRGEKKAYKESFEIMLKDGYKGGKVRIDHTENLKGAEYLKNLILEQFPNADVQIGENGGLCSFYAEVGGLIFGYETEKG